MGEIKALELSLVSDLVIPPKFKIPKFEKYDGIGCPMTHLTMYYRKMVGYTNNDMLLVYAFQDSLIRSVAWWYMQLDKNHI